MNGETTTDLVKKARGVMEFLHQSPVGLPDLRSGRGVQCKIELHLERLEVHGTSAVEDKELGPLVNGNVSLHSLHALRAIFHGNCGRARHGHHGRDNQAVGASSQALSERVER